MSIDNYRIRTSDKVPRGTVIMHPDDAATERSPVRLVAKLATAKRIDDRRFPKLDAHTSPHDDEVEKARLRRMVAEELDRRAHGFDTLDIPHDGGTR